MDLSKILTISGKPGLYKVISETRNGLIVEALADGRRIPVFATDRSSILEDISIFTEDGDLPLKEVVWKIYEKHDGQPLPNPKTDPAKTQELFERFVPEYDKERVYFAAITKVFNWYNALLKQDLISKPEKEEGASPEQPETEKKEMAKGEKAPSTKKTPAAKQKITKATAGKKETKKASNKSIKKGDK